MNSDRIREIQQQTAYPDSISVMQALMQVWNECEQERMVCHLKWKDGQEIHFLRVHVDPYVAKLQEFLDRASKAMAELEDMGISRDAYAAQRDEARAEAQRMHANLVGWQDRAIRSEEQRDMALARAGERAFEISGLRKEMAALMGMQAVQVEVKVPSR